MQRHAADRDELALARLVGADPHVDRGGGERGRRGDAGAARDRAAVAGAQHGVGRDQRARAEEAPWRSRPRRSTGTRRPGVAAADDGAATAPRRASAPSRRRPARWRSRRRRSWRQQRGRRARTCVGSEPQSPNGGSRPARARRARSRAGPRRRDQQQPPADHERAVVDEPGARRARDPRDLLDAAGRVDPERDRAGEAPATRSRRCTGAPGSRRAAPAPTTGTRGGRSRPRCRS